MGEVISGSEAVANGVLTEHQLRRWYRPVFRDIYVPADAELSLRDRTVAAWLWSRRRGAVAGVAASALHGARWVDSDTPIELIAPNARPQRGLLVRNETLGDDEVTRVAGIPVTTRARTAFDMGRHLPREVAVARLDARMRATPFSIEDVMVLIKRYRGARGLRNLKAVLPLVDGGAASPRETAVRLTLIEAGLPSPTTQIPVSDGWGFMAALDMGWPEFKVAVEYDSDHHRTNANT